MRRLFVWFFSISAAAVLFWTLSVLFNQEQTAPVNTQVVVVLKSLAQPMDFWTVVAQGIDEASREFSLPVFLTGPSHEREIELQLQIMNSVLKQNPSLIILVASDYKRLQAPVIRAKELNIPIITMDSDVDSTIPLSFVGTDNVEAGHRAGVHLASLLSSSPSKQVGIVSHIRETATGIDRELGVRRALEEAGIPVLGTWYAEVDQELAYRITLDLLDDPTIGGIVALNEVTTIGVAKALEDRKAFKQVAAIGFDNAPIILSYLERGILQATVVQRPYNMGYLAVRAAAQFLQGTQIPKVINTGSILITLDNMFEREYQELLFPFAETF